MKHKQRKSGGDTFYGKYRARVTEVYDGRQCLNSGRGRENRGRIKVECPDVYGEHESPWCEPLWGYAFDGHGDYVMPETGDYVYVEFEGGNTNLPIWNGAWVQKNRTPLTNRVMYDKEDAGCGRHGAPSPHMRAKTFVDSCGGEDGAYQKHHDATRVIQFGKFWIVMHRSTPQDGSIGDEDWLRVYMEDPANPKQELVEFFASEGRLWLKRKRGFMTFYTDDAETYLERKDSELVMTDSETVLRKGKNTVTMTAQDMAFDVPGNMKFKVGDSVVWDVTGGHSTTAASINESAPTISHN